MDNRKNNGGAGRGQGRKQKYLEPTEVVAARVPKSKIPHFITEIKKILKTYEPA